MHIAIPPTVAAPRAAWLRTAGFLIAALSLLIAGCSVLRVAYEQADRLLFWYVDGAFDLDDAQEARAKADIARVMAWHRRNELPAYLPLLARAQHEALGPVTPALACQRRDEFEARMLVTLDAALPILANLVPTLRPEQFEHLRKHLDEGNEKYRDRYLDDDPADRLEAATRFVVKRAELFYGSLSKAQRQQLEKDVAALPFDAQAIYNERLHWQQGFTALLRRLHDERASTEKAQQELRAFMRESIVPTQEPRRSRYAQWAQAGCRMQSALHERTTPEQRRKAAERLKSWEDDVRVLTMRK